MNEGTPMHREKPIFSPEQKQKFLERPDVAARAGKLENPKLEPVFFGKGEKKREYVTVTNGENSPRYIFPKDHPMPETEGAKEAVLLVPTEILQANGWLPDPKTGFLPFSKNGPKSYAAFLQFVAQQGMFGERKYMDPITKIAENGSTQTVYTGDENFLQIIPVGVQKNGIGQTFTVVRKQRQDSVNFNQALAGLTIQSTFLGHINNEDTQSSDETPFSMAHLMTAGARREAMEEIEGQKVPRRLLVLPEKLLMWLKGGQKPQHADTSTVPYDLFSEERKKDFTARPRGLVFRPNELGEEKFERTTAKSPESNVHMGLIFDITPHEHGIWEFLTKRLQAHIEGASENKLGVYLSKWQYERWMKGNLSPKLKERWMNRWVRMGWITEADKSAVPNRITPADWNPVLAGK